MSDIAEYRATPLEIVTQAIVKGTNPELLEKYMALEERWTATQSRKAFVRAMAAATAELRSIVKGNVVDFTNAKGRRVNYKYEDFATVSDEVRPILAKHNLFYNFGTKRDEDKLHVTCTLWHEDGFSQENSLWTKIDTSSGMNDAQAVGSAQTYLQRYTLKAALGVGATVDDDAQAATPVQPRISQAQIDKLKRKIFETDASADKLLQLAHVQRFEDLDENLYERSLKWLALREEGIKARGKGNAAANT